MCRLKTISREKGQQKMDDMVIKTPHTQSKAVAISET